MTRMVNIEITEHFCIEVDDVDGLNPRTDIVDQYDEMDSDDAAGAYDHRDIKIIDRETGEVLLDEKSY